MITETFSRHFVRVSLGGIFLAMLSLTGCLGPNATLTFDNGYGGPMMFPGWSYLGQPRFSTTGVGSVVATDDNNGAVYVFYTISGAAGGYLSTWNGMNWGSPVTVTPDSISSLAITTANNRVYVGFYDAGYLKIEDCTGGTCTPLPSPTGISLSTIDSLAIAADLSGNVYAAYHQSAGSVGLYRVNSTSASNMGSTTTSPTPSISIVVNSSGNAYVSDINTSGQPEVREYATSSPYASSPLGGPTATADSAASVSLAIDSKDNLYLAIQDQNVANRATVMALNGTSWVNLGYTGFSPGQAYSLQIKTDATGNLFASWMGAAHRLSASEWNGSNWNPIGSPADFDYPSASFISPSLVFTGNSEPTLVYADSLQRAVSAVSYRQIQDAATNLAWTITSPSSSTSLTAAWTKTPDQGLTDEQVQFYSDESCLTPMGSLIDLFSSSPTTLSQVGTPGSFLSYRVVDVFPSGYEVWSNCSAQMGVSAIWDYVAPNVSHPLNPGPQVDLSGHSPVALTVAPSGHIYVAFQDATTIPSGTLSVAEWNGSGWTSLGNNISSAPVTDLSIAVDGSENVYVSYSDGTTGGGNRLTVFERPAATGIWSSVGSLLFSPTAAYYTSIAVDGTGNIYVAYTDGSSGVYIDKWNGSSWTNFPFNPVTSPANTTLALDSSGNPFVAYTSSGVGASVYQCTPTLSTCTIIGTAIGTSSPTGLKFLISSSGTDYLSILDSGSATLYTYSTGWLPLGSATAMSTGPLSMAMGSTQLYLGFGDPSLGKASVEASTGGALSPLSASTGFSLDAITASAMAVDPVTQRPVIAYVDGTTNQLVVREYYP